MGCNILVAHVQACPTKPYSDVAIMSMRCFTPSPRDSIGQFSFEVGYSEERYRRDEDGEKLVVDDMQCRENCAVYFTSPAPTACTVRFNKVAHGAINVGFGGV
eukprot:3738109-Alexandrium_andersonii.AAC.1